MIGSEIPCFTIALRKIFFNRKILKKYFSFPEHDKLAFLCYSIAITTKEETAECFEKSFILTAA